MTTITLDSAYYIGVDWGANFNIDYFASPDGQSVFVNNPNDGGGVIVNGLSSVYVPRRPGNFVNFNMYEARSQPWKYMSSVELKLTKV